MTTPMLETPEVTLARKVVTAIPGPESVRLHERRQLVVAGAVSSALPVYIARGEGAVLVDVDGNQFLDFGTGIGVTTVGHAPANLVSNVQAQVEAFTHTCFTISPYQAYVDVCEWLAKNTPGTHAKKSALVNSGAEALENAVKFARHYTRRRAVVVLDHAFHGRTNLTMAMNYKIHPYGTGFGPFAGSVYHAPNSYPYRDGLTGAEAAARTIQYIETCVGAGEVACLVAEPIQGEGGFIVPADGYLTTLQEWCTERGILMVADEVQAGMGRTGQAFASAHFGWVPDLICTAKGIGGGLPLAAVTGRAEIMDDSHPGGIGGTYGGNPVACASALAVFESFDNGLIAEAERIERVLVGGLTRLAEKYDIIGEIRGKGAMIAIELVQPGTGATTKQAYPDAVAKIIAFAAQQGVLFLSAGTYYNVLRFLPSLVMTDAQIDEGLAVLDAALATL
ncbi:MAG TPA: 4-aminobutyrate--2-oxoglutarate transaminase [Candidatus Lumbricidophila sp.]|nr:4-aminobutyrate--2-oxoglutarate transaminase [Candidatus Lumbricidophila sp.]